MKGFYIGVKNDLLDPKHIKAMKESVWLFMWCIDKMTSISEEGIGKVLGGKPIKHEEIKKDLDISPRTYKRWISKLRKSGYINTIQAPNGLVISVNKAKKRGAKFGKRSAINCQRSATCGTSNIRQYKDNTITVKRINKLYPSYEEIKRRAGVKS